MNTINSVKSGRFESVLGWLKKRRTLALKIAFPALIIENIFTGDKPHELFPPGVSTMAVAGVILVVIGAFVRLWARGHFVKGRLFTTGPYALVRHPLYLGSFLVVCGALCQLNDWLNWVVILLLLVVFYGAAIVHEERALAKRFGREWVLYRAEVPAFIPSLRNWSLMQKGRWRSKIFLSTGELKTTLLFLGLPLLIELIEDSIFERLLLY